MKPITVEEFMTPRPVCIDASATVLDAYRRMQATGCRHLPVVREGTLLGLVSQRGLYRLERLTGSDRANEPVVDAMDVPYVAEPETPLVFVAEEMERRKTGACVVGSQGKVLGIFTTNDALTALATILSATAGTRRRRDAHAGGGPL